MAVVTVRTLRAVPPGDKTTLVGLRTNLTPPGAPDVVSCTVPLNPPTLATVMLSAMENPARIARLVGVVDRANPGTVTRTWTVLWRLPLAPTTVTLYVPDGVVEVAETVRTELPDPFGARATLVGFREVEGPGGAATAERDTLPENPPRLVRTIAVAINRRANASNGVRSILGFTPKSSPRPTPTVISIRAAK